MKTGDNTSAAIELFARFAARHGLTYNVRDTPPDPYWLFPVQPGVSLPFGLGLRGRDELNLEVEDFDTYIFPFESEQSYFEKIIDSWVRGEARIVEKYTVFRRTLELQLLESGRWVLGYGGVRTFGIFPKLAGTETVRFQNTPLRS
jgi:hypothetical protein